MIYLKGSLAEKVGPSEKHVYCIYYIDIIIQYNIHIYIYTHNITTNSLHSVHIMHPYSPYTSCSLSLLLGWLSQIRKVPTVEPVEPPLVDDRSA